MAQRNKKLQHAISIPSPKRSPGGKAKTFEIDDSPLFDPEPAPLPIKQAIKAEVKPKDDAEFSFDDMFAQSRTVVPRSSSPARPLGNEEAESPIHILPKELESYNPRTSKVALDDFDMHTLIGKGAYGKVYTVTRKATGAAYAMKVLRKEFLVRTDNVEGTKTEKDVLRKVRHAFVVSLHFSFQCEGRVYMVMDLKNGGQLFFHLRQEAMLSEAAVKFYAAEVVLAIDHLHQLDIIHRDLKPENILLDADGHIGITDFGLAKECMTDSARTKTFCGTLTYMAPEMVRGSDYGKAADWWSVGILIYDLLTGEPPFNSKDEQTLFKKILNDKVKLPKYLTAEACGIIKGLLSRDEKERLGSKGTGAIKNHPFFKTINWKKLANKQVVPPFKPKVSGPLDVSNFDTDYTSQAVCSSPCTFLSPEDQKLFAGFSFTRSDDALPIMEMLAGGHTSYGLSPPASPSKARTKISSAETAALMSAVESVTSQLAGLSTADPLGTASVGALDIPAIPAAAVAIPVAAVSLAAIPGVGAIPAVMPVAVVATD